MQRSRKSPPPETLTPAPTMYRRIKSWIRGNITGAKIPFPEPPHQVIHVDDFIKLMKTISTDLSQFFRDFRAVSCVGIDALVEDGDPASPDERGLTDQVWYHLIESGKVTVESGQEAHFGCDLIWRARLYNPEHPSTPLNVVVLLQAKVEKRTKAMRPEPTTDFRYNHGQQVDALGEAVQRLRKEDKTSVVVGGYVVYREQGTLCIPLQDIVSGSIKFIEEARRERRKITSAEINRLLTREYIEKIEEYSLDKFKPLEEYLSQKRHNRRHRRAIVKSSRNSQVSEFSTNVPKQNLLIKPKPSEDTHPHQTTHTPGLPHSPPLPESSNKLKKPIKASPTPPPESRSTRPLPSTRPTNVNSMRVDVLDRCFQSTAPPEGMGLPGSSRGGTSKHGLDVSEDEGNSKRQKSGPVESPTLSRSSSRSSLNSKKGQPDEFPRTVVEGIKFNNVTDELFKHGFKQASYKISGFMDKMASFRKTPDERGLSDQLAVEITKAQMGVRFVPATQQFEGLWGYDYICAYSVNGWNVILLIQAKTRKGNSIDFQSKRPFEQFKNLRTAVEKVKSACEAIHFKRPIVIAGYLIFSSEGILIIPMDDLWQTYDKPNARPDDINRQLSEDCLKNAAHYAAWDFHKHVSQKIKDEQESSRDISQS